MQLKNQASIIVVIGKKTLLRKLLGVVQEDNKVQSFFSRALTYGEKVTLHKIDYHNARVFSITSSPKQY